MTTHQGVGVIVFISMVFAIASMWAFFGFAVAAAFGSVLFFALAIYASAKGIST